MAETTPATTLVKMDEWCAARRRTLILCLLGVAVLLRIVVYCELRETPVFTAHEIPQMDMSFFDKWAVNIAEKDFLSKDTPLHPIHHWHHLVGEQHFKAHPDQLSSTHAGKVFDELTNREKTVEVRNLWVKWYGGYRFHQEPLYPYFLAAVYSLVGRSDVGTVFILQMLIGVVTIGLMFGVTRRLFNDLAAVLAGLMVVFWPPLIHYETVLLRTSLLVFFGAALLYSAQRLIVPGRRPAWKWFVFGCAIGLATALKTTLFVIGTGLLVGVLWSSRRKRASCLRAAGWTAAGIFVCLAPFFARNVIAGAPVFSLTSVGAVTFAGSNLPSHNPWMGWYPFESGGPIADVMHASQGATLATIRATIDLHESVFDLPDLWWHKILVTCHWFEIPNNVDYYFHNLHSSIRTVMRYLVSVWWLVPCALVGLVAAWRTRGSRLWLWYAVCSLGPMLVFYVLSRFRVPMVVGLMPFAAFGILRTLEWIGARAWTRAIPAIAVLLAMAIWMNREPPVPIVRGDQYGSAFKYHYFPRLEAAEKNSDIPQVVTLLDEFIESAPAYVELLGPTRRPRTVSEVRTARFFVTVYQMHAKYLTMTHSPRANYYDELARRIKSVLPPPIKRD